MTDTQWTFDPSRYEGHTPGPWCVKQGQDGAEVHTDDLTVCRLHDEGKYSDPVGPIDARLIADAPMLLAKCVRLQAIVDRLPKTADGVPVVPGTQTPLWNPDYAGTGYYQVDASWIEHTPDCLCEWSVTWGGPGHDASDVGRWYSTEQAAEAARKEQGDAAS